MKRAVTILTVTTMGLAAVGLSFRSQAAAQAPASKPAFTVETVSGIGTTRTAVVNLVRIFDARDGCDQIKDLNNVLRQSREDTTKEAEIRKKLLDEAKAKLTAYRPESPDYAPAKEAVVKQNIEFNAWMQGKKEELDGDEFRWMARMYEMAAEATRKVAEDKKIELVITSEPFDAGSAGDDLRALQAQIRGRKVIYSTPAADITDAVIASLNADYKARGGKSTVAPPGGATAQPVAPKK